MYTVTLKIRYHYVHVFVFVVTFQLHKPLFSKHWTRHIKPYKILTVMEDHEYYIPNHMDQIRAYNHKINMSHYTLPNNGTIKHQTY